MRKVIRNDSRNKLVIGLITGVCGVAVCAIGICLMKKPMINEQERIVLDEDNFLQEYLEEDIEMGQFDEENTYPLKVEDDQDDSVSFEGQQITDGEYIELLGTLLKREDGEIIVQLETPVLFRGTDGTSEIESVGLTGEFDSADYDHMLGKSVSVYGMAMEANTAYHYEKVMILDGYNNLKLLSSTRNIQVTRIDNYLSNKQCTSYIIPIYEEERQIGGIEYLPDGKEKSSYIYEYDENGNMVRETWFNLDGTIYYWNESDFDEQGNKLRLRHFSGNDIMNYFYEFQYNEAGQCVLEVRYDPYGVKQSYFENEYDASKLKVKSSLYNSNGDNMTHWIEYEYDPDGNCISEVWYQASGIIMQSIERHYE